MDTLKQLCAAKESDKRLELILSLLRGNPHVQQYHTKFKNIYTFIDAGKPKTIAITAHYDIANVNSDNCLDNNASVRNLIRLHNQLGASKRKLKFNVLIAFIDGEETVDFDKCGIKHLVHNFDVDQLIDLELTASGNNVVMNKYGDFDVFDYPIYRMPFNNAAVADYWKQKNPDLKIRGSACLVAVDDKDIKELNKRGFCHRWMKCHSETDSIDSANEVDMNKIVETLYQHLVEPEEMQFEERVSRFLGGPR